ncbi:hypothetical protein BJX99DRAFT_249446 [Aspergillus californicus]
MLREYTELWRMCPRSFLFAIVANVGPGSESRSLAVAYRQGDNHYTETYFERVDHFVTETLALIEILSDPANRAPLEAEKALAQDWYWQSEAHNKNRFTPRSTVPDSVQPPWEPRIKRNGPLRPELPWREDTLTVFPFTTTCLLLGLLGDNGAGNAKGTKRGRTRPGDVQLQPLSTVFLGKCLEYGLVVLDISDLDSGVKYGITAFPVRYMAEVKYFDESFSWDPVEDSPPEDEPDIIPFSPRPRELLSILQWLSRYYGYDHLDDNPGFPRLENMALADCAALDSFIWSPLKRATSIKKRSTTRSPAEMVGNTLLHDPSRGTSLECAKDDSTTRASSFTILDDQPQDIPEDIDRVIDDLLVLTHEADEHPLERSAVDNLQILAKFPEQLREQLEDDPDRLGPFKISSNVLAIAYAGRSHLNWAMFQKLTPSVIAVAIISDELQGASALSLCADQFELERDGDLKELTAAVSQCTGLRQLCVVQRPTRDSDDSSARSYSQLLLLWQRRALEEQGGKTIYATCAFSTSLRSRCPISSSTLTRSLTSSDAHIPPVMHMFMFGHYEGGADDVQPYQNYYAMNNTLLDAESFAVRFLAYLSSLSLGSNSEKAILQFAYNGASSSSSGQLGVIPIPAGFFDHGLPPNHPSRVKLGDIPPGSWIVLVDSPHQISGETPIASWDSPPPYSPSESDADLTPTDQSDFGQPAANMGLRSRSSSSSPSSDDNDDLSLHYSFVKIHQVSAVITPHQQQQQQQQTTVPVPVPVPTRAEVVGGLIDFLRETAPGTDIPTWEKQVEEVERDICTGNRSIDMDIGCYTTVAKHYHVQNDHTQGTTVPDSGRSHGCCWQRWQRWRCIGLELFQ